MRITILAMSTWGALGNWLSARALAKAIATAEPQWEITLVRTGECIDTLRTIGEEISRITKEASSGSQRRQEYSSIMSRWHDWYSREHTDNTPRFLGQLSSVASLLAASDPEIVIGTKGLLSRIAVATRCYHTLPYTVVNYVTNHGHFQFPLHQCEDVDGYLVRLDLADAYIRETCSASANQIVDIGYLLPYSQCIDKTGDAECVSTGDIHAVLLSNRGGPGFLTLLHCLSKAPWISRVVSVFLEEPSILADAQTIAGGCAKTKVRDSISQEEYMKFLNVPSSLRLFVSKCSPNAVFEALACGMVPLLVRSGLPMEDWAADLVEELEVGVVCDSAAELAELIANSSQSDFLAYRPAAASFVRTTLQQEAIPSRAVNALRRFNALRKQV